MSRDMEKDDYKVIDPRLKRMVFPAVSFSAPSYDQEMEGKKPRMNEHQRKLKATKNLEKW